MLVTRVSPRSRLEIRGIAARLRRVVGAHGRFDIVQFMDVDLYRLDPEYELQLQSEEAMGAHEGLTFPDRRLVVIREDVYEAASEGQGRARFTMAHELGHFVLHQQLCLAFGGQSYGPVPSYRDAEWQSNVFAAELLMPCDEVEGSALKSPTELVKAYGVSQRAAEVQWQVYRSEGILDGKK